MGGGLGAMPLYNMKKNILFILLLLCTFTVAQTIDTIKWVNYSNTQLNITFEYPSFMLLEKNFNPNISEIDSFITLSFTDYPIYGTAADLGIGDSTDTLYLDLYQSLDIIISELSLFDIASMYGYLYKDSVWFDSEMYEHGWHDEPATEYSIDGWVCYETYTPTRVYLKDGGCITAAGDMKVFFLTKKINDTTSIFLFGSRFDFDNAEIVLKRILNSISLIN